LVRRVGGLGHPGRRTAFLRMSGHEIWILVRSVA